MDRALQQVRAGWWEAFYPGNENMGARPLSSSSPRDEAADDVDTARIDGGGREAYSFDIEGQDSRVCRIASSESARAKFFTRARREMILLTRQMRALLYWYIARFATRRWN